MRRAVFAVVAVGLLTSATPPPQRLSRAPIVLPPATSPVRCRAGESNRPTFRSAPVVVTGARANQVPQAEMAYAPPPPPPPPPLVAPAARGIVAQSAPKSFRAGGATPPYGSRWNTERYDGRAVAAIQDTSAAPVSTFSVDVDTGAYANVRRFLNRGAPVPAEAVRTEEMINYFRYHYPRPASTAEPFSITTDVARTPWNPNTRLLRIGLRAYDVQTATRPRANLVFLVDTSGSMQPEDRLPLVKRALEGLADQLRPDDRVSIVAYAGSAGIVLEPTANRNYVKAALACLDAGGSTAGGAGIELAYATARAAFVPGGVNRIFLATDGDFNVGISDKGALEALVKRNRDDGITLTTLGFGQGNLNDAMMERIADVGNGNYSYIDSASEARKVLEEELSATMVTVAKDVKVQVEFNPAQVTQYRLIGYENRALAEEDFTNDGVDAGDMGAGHQVTALYEVAPAGGFAWTPTRRYPGNRPPAVVQRGAELAFVKLRYKLPYGDTSSELSRPVPAAMMTSARAPQGDMAFATAVAAFGQKLRGDKYLGSYGYADIRALAGDPRGLWRQQFVELTHLADRGGGAAAGGARSGVR
ncbi:VWA domain-containing protein [Sphingomonas sp.]|jgi:Ca-activated chloride channel family protein|uniref:vWA domain-containing protein n=1 Tax=Sphingomonas sp. TaxID=28214 RepID=UPI002D7FA82B|nr:VWA domain-containing protein [Sphingomonas sp.]HEU0043076.1 VWA domain-containing protein [Sphingomonas sp.]